MTRILFKNEPSIMDSDALNNLFNMINQETSITPQKKLKKLPESKGDITMPIELINLVLTGITTLITIIQFWKSQYPQYKISMKIGDDTFEMENLSKKEFNSALENAQENQQDIDLLINSGDG